jgi:hypothetical protein
MLRRGNIFLVHPVEVNVGQSQSTQMVTPNDETG